MKVLTLGKLLFWQRLTALLKRQEVIWIKPQPTVYKIGGGWGDRIEWFDQDTTLTPKKRKLKLNGWKENIPECGDVIDSEMQSGKIGRFVFTQVKRCSDPQDMFFGEVVFIGYL